MLRFGSVLTLLLASALLFSGCAHKAAQEEEPAPEPVAVAEPVVQAPVTQTEQPVAPEQQPPVSAMDESELKMVLFEFDSYRLTDAARDAIAKYAIWLGAHPEKRIVIEGYCDERGSDEYNLALGERRAIEVRNYLASLGVAEKNCSIVSFGEEQPVAEGHDEIACAMNRHAELKEIF
jgi:peptidoglycan-associated lipoprotein